MVAPVQLPHHWTQFLSRQPETGMTFQIVDVTLRDGRIVRDVVIVRGALVAGVSGRSDIPFDPADITNIEVKH
ncbi:MAG: hypothetical protein ABR611_15880 [Chthoniobacterales bacterium]